MRGCLSGAPLSGAVRRDAPSLPEDVWTYSPLPQNLSYGLWINPGGTEVGDFQPASSTGKANEDNLFRTTNDGWIFNLDVRPLGEGSRTLRVDLGDGRFHDVVILVGASGSQVNQLDGRGVPLPRLSPCCGKR